VNKRSTAPDVTPLLLTIPEAAATLRCSPRHLYKLTAMGDLPVVMLGNRRRIPRVALEEWVATHQTRLNRDGSVA
jgi:excisionase family DNA binding protein